MLRIHCPYCGERDEIEFRYRGDASARRRREGEPDSFTDASAPEMRDAELEAFNTYVYERDNPHGWHLEWWLHVGGCRKLLKLARHTFTHEIAWIGGPQDTPDYPQTTASETERGSAPDRQRGPKS